MSYIVQAYQRNVLQNELQNQIFFIYVKGVPVGNAK